VQQGTRDRELNLVIYGLGDVQLQNPSHIAKEICENLEHPSVEFNASRIGKSKFAKLTFNNESGKLKILTNAKKLRHHAEFKKIFINPDLTTDQLAANKLVRENLKCCRTEEPNHKFGIRNGKVVKIEQDVRTVVVQNNCDADPDLFEDHESQQKNVNARGRKPGLYVAA